VRSVFKNDRSHVGSKEKGRQALDRERKSGSRSGKFQKRENAAQTKKKPLKNASGDCSGPGDEDQRRYPGEEIMGNWGSGGREKQRKVVTRGTGGRTTDRGAQGDGVGAWTTGVRTQARTPREGRPGAKERAGRNEKKN